MAPGFMLLRWSCVTPRRTNQKKTPTYQNTSARAKNASVFENLQQSSERARGDAGQELNRASTTKDDKAPIDSPAPTLPLACSDRSSVTMLIGFMPAFSARVYGITSSADEAATKTTATNRGRQCRELRLRFVGSVSSDVTTSLGMGRH